MRGNRRQIVPMYRWLFVGMLGLALSIASFQLVFVSTAAAEQQGNLSEVPKPVLKTGSPESTSPSVMMPASAVLKWTPTGSNDTEDSYDIRVAQVSNMDAATGMLTTPVMQQDGLTSAEYSISSLTDGIYYWQVRSCNVLICGEWSAVWIVTIDGIAPVAPDATLTSGLYDKYVAFAGQAEPGTRVTAAVNDSSCSVVADQDGSWNCQLTTEFEYGNYTANVVSKDTAGNTSQVTTIEFSVNELFVAPQITTEELPQVIEIVPVSPAYQVAASLATPVPIAAENVNIAIDNATATQTAPKPLSTDGGIVQSSENGWQIFGLPWFVWLVATAGIVSIWFTLGLPTPKQLSNRLLSSS